MFEVLPAVIAKSQRVAMTIGEAGEPSRSYSSKPQRELPCNNKSALLNWSDEGCNFIEVEAISR
jgi:hypothetical protein